MHVEQFSILREIFLAEVFLVEDVGGRRGSGWVGALVRCGTWMGLRVRGVVPVASREHGTSNGSEA